MFATDLMLAMTVLEIGKYPIENSKLFRLVRSHLLAACLSTFVVEPREIQIGHLNRFMDFV